MFKNWKFEHGKAILHPARLYSNAAWLTLASPKPASYRSISRSALRHLPCLRQFKQELSKPELGKIGMQKEKLYKSRPKQLNKIPRQSLAKLGLQETQAGPTRMNEHVCEAHMNAFDQKHDSTRVEAGFQSLKLRSSFFTPSVNRIPFNWRY